MLDYLVVIPARLASDRLPRKPLIDLVGTPMIVRTYHRASAVFPRENIVVATDSAEIEEVCKRHDIDVIATSDTHLTGTDRVAEVARRIAARTYINLQGDEPLFNSADLVALKDAALAAPEVVLNGYCPLTDAEQYESRTVPKVVFDLAGKLLYMSRAPIPGGKDPRFGFGYRQVCAYAFPPAALAAFSATVGKTPFEEAEDIELLRLVELGFAVQMVEMSGDSIAVDTPDDVVRASAAIRRLEQATA